SICTAHYPVWPTRSDARKRLGRNEVATMIRPVGPLRALGRWGRPLAVVAGAAPAGGGGARGPFPRGRAGVVQPARPPAPGGGRGGAGSVALTLGPPALGTILTTGKGFTVYAFEADNGTTSACTGACAAAWPPVTASGGRVMVAGGASMSLVAETTRDGGTHQLTYAGHPLYTYIGDSGPGVTSGQGSEAFGARWDVLNPIGHEVTGG